MKTYFILSISFLLVLTSCEHKQEEKVRTQNVELMSPPPVVEQKSAVGAADALEDNSIANKPADKPSPITDTSKKIIKEGDIRFETADPKKTKGVITSSLKKLGGYLAEENETNNGENNQKEYSLKIRVPAKNFDTFLNTLTSSADHIDSKNIHVRDVTTTFIDLGAQIGNKKQLEQRYLQLAARAVKMTDLLAIEDKLASIRTEIDSAQGQLNYLGSQVSYSSLDISFYTKQGAQVNQDDGFAYKFKNSLNTGWEVMQNLFFSIISLWPLMLAVIIIYILAIRFKRRRTASRVAEE